MTVTCLVGCRLNYLEQVSAEVGDDVLAGEGARCDQRVGVHHLRFGIWVRRYGRVGVSPDMSVTRQLHTTTSMSRDMSVT